MICAAVAFAGAALAEATLEEHQAELGSVKSRIESLRKELADAETEKDAQQKALRELEERIGDVSRRIHDLVREQGIRRRHLEQLEADRAAREAELAAHGGILAEQVRASYALGRQQRLKLLLNQQDPVRLGRILTYYEYLQRQRVAELDAVRESLARLNQTRKTIAAEESRLERLLVDEQAARASLQSAQQERTQVVTGLDDEIRQRGAEVSRLQQDEARLKQLVDRLKQVQERLAAIRDIEDEAEVQTGPFVEQRGRLGWPSPGRIRSAFGTAKGAGLSWDGIVISAPAGNEVRAIHSGRVVYADWLKGYGLLVIVDHGDGYMSLYGYNQSLFKAVGDWVAAGEVIALVGNSGGRAEPALYFGIRHNGKPVDPARWCKRGSGRQVGGSAMAYRRFVDVA